MWRRLANRAGEGRGACGCCWYHSGRWAPVIDTAVRLIAQAEAASVTSDDELIYEVLAEARAEDVSGWPLEALSSLLIDPITIDQPDPRNPARPGNGQHRTRAMRNAGLKAVLVVADTP